MKTHCGLKTVLTVGFVVILGSVLLVAGYSLMPQHISLGICNVSNQSVREFVVAFGQLGGPRNVVERCWVLRDLQEGQCRQIGFWNSTSERQFEFYQQTPRGWRRTSAYGYYNAMHPKSITLPITVMNSLFLQENHAGNLASIVIFEHGSPHHSRWWPTPLPNIETSGPTTNNCELVP